jgi:hypothetical protein
VAVRRIKNIHETQYFEDVVATSIDNMLASFAARAIQGKNKIVTRQKPSRVTTYVGGQEGRDERTVKIGESIRYHFDHLKKIVIDAHRRLVLNSPVQIGPDSWGIPADKFRYADSHVILCNGKATFDPMDIPEDAQEVIITNLMPYARKVEMRGWRGPAGGFHVPYHTYELTATELRKYLQIVNIKFTFVDMPGYAVGKYATHRLASRRAAAQRYPALIISVKS